MIYKYTLISYVGTAKGLLRYLSVYRRARLKVRRQLKNEKKTS